MTYTKLRWQRQSDRLVCHLPFDGCRLELAAGYGPPGTQGVTGDEQGMPRLWCRVLGADPDWPTEQWFRLTDVRGGLRRWVDRVEGAGGFIGALHDLRADYWEAYAKALEANLEQATHMLDGEPMPKLPQSMVPDVQDPAQWDEDW